MELPQTIHYLCVSLIKKDTIMKEYTITHFGNGEIVMTTFSAINPLDALKFWQATYLGTSTETILSITRSR